MADPLIGSPGVLQSVLEALDEPGQALRNLLLRRYDAAGRKAADFLGDLVDAPLPGDWIPHVSRPEDDVSGGDLLGLTEPGLKKTAADVLVGTLTDPLSALTFPAAGGVRVLGHTVAAAGRTVDPLTLAMKGGGAAVVAAAKAADRILGSSATATTIAREPVQQAVRELAQRTRNALGWHDLTPEQRTALDTAKAAGASSARAGTEEAGRIMAGLTPDEQVALGDAIDAVQWEGGKAVGVLPGATVEARLQALAHANPKLRLERLIPAAAGVRKLAQTQLQEGQRLGVFRPGMGADDYLQRQFHFDDRAAPAGAARPSAGSSSIAGRELDGPASIVDFLTKNPGAQYERNAARRLVERAGQQGRLVERAALGRGLVGPEFTLAEDADRGVARQTIEALAKTAPDYAYRLDQAFNGMAPRGGFTSLLATANRFFKPAAVYGVVIPKVGSIVRNQVGMVWQAFSTPGVPLSTQRHALSNLLSSFDDGWEAVTNSRLTKGHLTEDLKLVEDAYKKSGGSGEAVTAALRAAHRDDLAEAVEHGVLDGFVSSEEILKKVRSSGVKGWTGQLYDMPGVIFQGVEQRGRLGTFLDLRARHGAAKASQLTKDAFLDYSVTGEGNRRLRDIIPFAQFLAKSVPQQARLLSTTPAVGVALAPLIGQDDQLPVYPFVADQTHIPLGLNTQGNPEYAVGLGLPIEQLGSIPDLSSGPMAAGRSVKRHLVSSLHPILKSLFGYVSGEDPYFETPYGSYGKEPLTGRESSAGRAYRQLAGTGLIEPVASGLRQVEKLADPRRSAGVKALDLLTGTNVVDVDPDLAEQRIVSDALRQHPDVKKYETYYQTGQDPEVDELMKRLGAAKEKLKEKRAEAKMAAGVVL
jgi:hypothetical protein